MADIFFSGRLPVPPSINRSYKSFLNPKTGKSAFAGTGTARAFKKAAAKQLANAVVDRSVVDAIRAAKQKKQQIPLEVTIHFYFEHRWTRDIDSGLKVAIDAVFKHLKMNDNLIVDLHIKKRMDKTDPRVHIEISIAEE
jgi:Holliday junction resolvase RusA-like endonuclease